jgi:hypothetical protein
MLILALLTVSVALAVAGGVWIVHRTALALRIEWEPTLVWLGLAELHDPSGAAFPRERRSERPRLYLVES